MLKSYRKGVHVEVSLVSQKKKLLCATSDPVNGSNLGHRGFIQRFRDVVSHNIIKRMIRPSVFRLRRYFTFPLVEELQTIRAAFQQEQQELRQLILAIQQQVDTVQQYSYVSARRVSVACGPDEVLVRTSVGYVLCSSRDHAVLACLVDTGELERGTRLLIERIVKLGDVFIDVGANLGLHTLAAARAMHGKGRIIAFEPFGLTKCLLEKNVRINGFSDIVEIHQSAVSSHPGYQPLYLGKTSGHHSLFPLEESAAASVAPVSVPLVTLDAVMADHPTVNVVKIDAEGAELDVVEGGRNVLQQNPNIVLIVEFGLSHLRRTDQIIKNWFAHFESLGMVYKVINPDTGTLEDWSIDKLASTESVNLLFARPLADVWLSEDGAG